MAAVNPAGPAPMIRQSRGFMPQPRRNRGRDQREACTGTRRIGAARAPRKHYARVESLPTAEGCRAAASFASRAARSLRTGTNGVPRLFALIWTAMMVRLRAAEARAAEAFSS